MSVELPFNQVEWEVIGPFSRQKSFKRNDQTIRLLELSPGFDEPSWCTQGHVGYVASGELRIRFEHETLLFQQGDGFHLPAGESSKHIAQVTDRVAVLFLVEDS